MSTEEKAESLRAWVRRQGGEELVPLSVVESESRGLGLRVDRAVGDNEIILRLPATIMISDISAKDSVLG